MNSFTRTGNQNPLVKTGEAVRRDINWFAEELKKAGVSPLELSWGNHKTHFLQVPAEKLDTYLKLRQKLLHDEALRALDNA